MTYYKFAEREAGSQINWAEVSKGLTDTIYQIDKDRQDKKAAIDESTRQDMLKLANAPKGDNTTASEWTLKYTNDMMNYRLTIDRLLKTGQMSLRDYKIAAQNSKDSTNLLFSVAQEYQDKYKEIQDRMKQDKSSALEPQLAALSESLANISNTIPRINPTNGMVYLAGSKQGKDGVTEMDENFVSLQSLRNRINATVDKYNMRDALESETSKLGENVFTEIVKSKKLNRTGVITEIADPTARAGFDQWKKDTVKLIVGEGYQTASLLADNVITNPKTGKQYAPTYNRKEWEADKTGDLILFENINGNGPLMPVFKDEQIKTASEFVDRNVTSYIDKKAESKLYGIPGVDWVPQHVTEANKEAKESQNALELWNQIYTATTPQAKEAAKAGVLGSPKAIEAGLLDIDFSSPGVAKFIYSKPEKNRSISISGKGDDWARAGSEFHGITDNAKLSRYSGLKEGGTSETYKGVGGGRAGQKINVNLEKFKEETTTTPLKDNVIQDDATETSNLLNNSYSKYGFTFTPDESGFRDNVVVKYNGVTVGTPIPVDRKDAGAAGLLGIIRSTLENPPPTSSPEPNPQNPTTITGGTVR